MSEPCERCERLQAEIAHLRHCNTTLEHTQSEAMAGMVIERERLEGMVARLRGYARWLENRSMYFPTQLRKEAGITFPGDLETTP